MINHDYFDISRIDSNGTNYTNYLHSFSSLFVKFGKFIKFVFLTLALFMASCSGNASSNGEVPKSSSDLARQFLIRYFELLHDGRYFEASHFYGGSYEVLQDWNPNVVSSDHATLFQLGCEQNGLMCFEISNFISTEELSNGYRFTVEFTNDAGEILVIGDCCSASDDSVPRQSHFKFTVLESGDGFLVQELPVYVP